MASALAPIAMHAIAPPQPTRNTPRPLQSRSDAPSGACSAFPESPPSTILTAWPHPDIFLAAAERLGVPPAACLVFEDAPLGIEAARRAGMAAVALTTTLPAAAFDGHANLMSTMPDFTGYRLPERLPAPSPGLTA